MNRLYTGNTIKLQTIKKQHMLEFWHLIYSHENPEWKKFDAPYFPLKPLSLDEFVTSYDGNRRMSIFLHDDLIGEVSYYWEHQASNWLEAGICIYDSKYWANGYGQQALSLWISHLFNTMDLVRVGLTTWSGNQGMMKLAEKLGMRQEACLRKCRLWQGDYYDSIRYGILKEEWKNYENKN